LIWRIKSKIIKVLIKSQGKKLRNQKKIDQIKKNIYHRLELKD
jgi:hypothetical protein